MLTNEAAAADAAPPAVAGLDEEALPGELADPEDPQAASETARTASARAGASSVLRRACLIASIRPMDAPPFPPPPALSAVIVAEPRRHGVGFTGAEP